MKKRYLVLTALLALSLAACSQDKAKNEDGETKTEQSVVSLKELPRRKQKWSIKETITAFKGNTMKSS